jgi:hypothetical protein
MKQFDIKLTNDQSGIDGIYNIYYYINALKYLAKIYNPKGLSVVQAKNLSYSELTNGSVVRIDVPDTVSKIVVEKVNLYDKTQLTFTNYSKNINYNGNNDGFVFNSSDNSFSFKSIFL